MDDEISSLFGYAYDCGIGVEAGCYDPDWIPLAIPSQKLIVINLNWGRKREIPLTIAHETSHVLAGGADFATYTRTSTDPAEAAANKGALQILVNLFVDGYADVENFALSNFMEHFMIPYGYTELVKELVIEKLQ